MNKKCQKCVIIDDPKGFSYCQVCNNMVSDTFIQNTVEFQSGTGAMHGTIMPKNGNIQPMIRPGKDGGALVMSGDSRTQRINKFYKIIDHIAQKLNINSSIRDMGHHYHKIASITKN